MKRLSLLLALSFCLLSFGLANAINFDVVVDPAYQWNDGTNDYTLAGQDFKLELQMQNNDGVDWVGYSMPLHIYADGDIAAWSYVAQSGGYAAPMDFIVPVTEPWASGWASIDTWTTASLDGVGADTINHSVLDLSGWIYADDQDMLTRYEIWMNIVLVDTDMGLDDRVVVSSISEFNPPMTPPTATGFSPSQIISI